MIGQTVGFSLWIRRPANQRWHWNHWDSLVPLHVHAIPAVIRGIRRDIAICCYVKQTPASRNGARPSKTRYFAPQTVDFVLVLLSKLDVLIFEVVERTPQNAEFVYLRVH